jgi:acetate kinase
MKILVLNSGSSSQKARLYDLPGPLPDSPASPVWEGKVEWAENVASLEVRSSNSAVLKKQLERRERSDATAELIRFLVSGETRVLARLSQIDVVGHRIVTGGRKYNCATLVSTEVKEAIRQMAFLAPLHNRFELEGIELIEKECGAVPQVALFDTSFHAELPEPAAIYAGPYEWAERGIRKFGFHGINHQYCAERAEQLFGKNLSQLKLVTCHLGNGCSLAAVHNGHSIDTTMGFTPLDGLMMGTRSGSVDPGILTYLLREDRIDAQTLDETLNTKSGLLGISGLSGDMRQIQSAMKAGNARAQLAFHMFVHHLRSGIGSMIAALGGIDALVFTAGIGENSPEVRTRACANFAFLGLLLDPLKNDAARGDSEISSENSSVRVLVLEAQEDWMIAKECWKLGRGFARVVSPP